MNPFLLQLLAILAPYIVPFILAGLWFLIRRALDLIPTNVRPLLASIVTDAVRAVEQLAATELNDAGKKALAIKFVEEELAHFHIDIPTSIISTMIESAVHELNNPPTFVSPVVSPTKVMPAIETRGVA